MADSKFQNFSSVWKGWTFRVVGNAMTVTNGTRTMQRDLLAASNMQHAVFITMERLKEDIAEYEKTGTIRQKGSAEISLRSLAHGLALALVAFVLIVYFGAGRFLPMPVILLIIFVAFVFGFIDGKDRERSSGIK